jgi:sugar/nucleoside kinase (ribokinase family)
MGKTGDDLFGQAIVDIVRRYGPELAEGMIVDPQATSSYTVVIDPPRIDRIFLHCGGANHTFGADDVRYDVLAEARLFHLGYPPLLGRLYADDGRELLQVYQRAKGTGITTSLDMTMPDPAGPSGQADWQTILGRCLPHVDLFLPSAEEWLFMVDRARWDRLSSAVGAEGMPGALEAHEIRALGKRALDMGAKVVVLKLGARGIYMRTASALAGMGRGAPADLASWRGRELWAPSFVPEPLVGTTGAGDATIAGFLAALLRGAGPERALTIAAAVGACNVEAADALSGVRTWDETLARIDAGWQQAPLSLPGWWVDAQGVWHSGAHTH